jgi:hypothetical protein
MLSSLVFGKITVKFPLMAKRYGVPQQLKPQECETRKCSPKPEATSRPRHDRQGPKLLSWRRHKLRHGLQEAAQARGEPMTREDADYAIGKALASNLLDSPGRLNFIAKGSPGRTKTYAPKLEL